MASVKKNLSEGPFVKNFTKNQGESITISGRFTANGVAVDVSADDFFLRVVDRKNQPVADLSVGSGISFPATNTPLAILDTADYPLDQQLHYTLRWVRASDGLVTDIQSGYILITPNNTPTA